MEIEFVGGARTVTGSSYILKTNNFSIMVDCGMFQGTEDLKERNQLNLIYAAEKIDAVFLTHAHIDHSGLIPKLVKHGFKGKIYATEATVDLCNVMLPDSAHIQASDAKISNLKRRRQGRKQFDPIYTMEDVEKSLKHFEAVEYNELQEIFPNLKVKFRDAGHILGSAMIEMWITENNEEKKIVFSGDLGQKDQLIIRNPEYIEDADYLFLESTYGNRLHKSKDDTYEEFKNVILETYEKGGNIIIPAFAVERTQEIIFLLGKLFRTGDIPKIPVVIDSPLAINATEIFRKHPENFDKETATMLVNGKTPLKFPNLSYTRSTEESKNLNNLEEPVIILSASGMCTAGRIKFHLMNNLYRPESTIVFVGFQAEGTLGRKLIDGATIVKIHGEDVIVKANICTLGGFSAHADQKDLCNWFDHFKEKEKMQLFIVHGEETSSLALADKFKEKFNANCIVPKWGEIINLKTMETRIASYGTKGVTTDVDFEIEKMLDYAYRYVNIYQTLKEKNNDKYNNEIRVNAIKARETLARLIDKITK